MTSATLTAAELVAAPVAATAVGSILATRRPPSASATSALQHLAAGSELLERGTPARHAAAIPIAASTAIILGATGGAALLSHANDAVLAGFLAFGSAALLYLVIEELLTEAHDTPDTNVHIILFFVGFVALYTLEGIV